MICRGVALATAAESFIGTPFRLRGRDPRTGLDCVGLVAAAFAKLGWPVQPLPPYSLRQQSFATQLECATGAGLDEVAGSPMAGDLLLVRPGPAQVHLGIVNAGGAFIHAHAGLGKVVATPPPLPWPIERHWRLRNN
jgi:cell wall-associated NlpC family hydrolase